MADNNNGDNETTKETQYIMAIDSGTQSVRIIIYSDSEEIIVSEQADIESQYPKPGWVQQNPVELIEKTVKLISSALLSFCSKINIPPERVPLHLKGRNLQNH
jgi:glycerol kinase